MVSERSLKMITLSYIVLKITVLSLIHLWISVKCSRRSKKKAMSSTSSYIEENTKAEEKMDRPMWDKNFPKILPPPENKEVDVELDMLVIPGGSVLDEPKPKAKKATPRMDVLDPNELIFDDRTQGSHEPLNKSKEKLAMA
ncbi:hypothetical protein COOONC_17004, partial [Cooperia oncophora]